MKIKNLTSKILTLKVEDIVGGASYEIYLMPHGETSLESQILLNQKDLSDSIAVDSGDLQKVERTPVRDKEEVKEEEEKVKEEEEKVKEEVKEESKEILQEDAFICKECGAEFASARGLSSHMNRSHHQ